ncbi:9404_t:CDS:2, partial [Diversispora eburnea]
MDLYTKPSLFRYLKILQLLLTLACLSLEIMQIIEFTKYYSDLNIPTSKFFEKFGGYGIKIYFYIVIIITIIVIGWYIIRFNVLWRDGSSYRDMGIDGFFAILWIVSGITNITPTNRGILNCSSDNRNQVLECQAYYSSLSCGWANALLFIITGSLSWRLSWEREWRGTTHRQSVTSQLSRA